MKIFRAKQKKILGFSLVEATLSIGILSFGFLTLAPLLGLGLNTFRGARDARTSAQIAETLEQQAQQGTLTAGPGYFDQQGTACASPTAWYRAGTSLTTNAATGVHLTVQVTPVGNPQRAQFYAVVLLPP